MRASRRRRALPEAFARAASEVEQAQRALLTAVPKPRDDGAPLGLALAAFTAGLRRADAELAGWDHPARATVDQAIEAARAAADALRLHPGALDFAALNEAIGAVLAPLEEIHDVERALLRA